MADHTTHTGIVRTASGRQVYAADGLDDGAPMVRLQEEVSESIPTPGFQTPGSERPIASRGASHLSSASTIAAAPINISTSLEGAEKVEGSKHDPYLEHDGIEAVETPPRPASISEGFEPINPGDSSRLTYLAKTISRPSHSRHASTVNNDGDLERMDTVAGLDIKDPVFDPSSEKFDLNKWLRMTLRIFNEEGIKISRAGVTFKDLNVSGRGAALQTQGTVLSTLTAPFRVAELFARKPNKRILRNFTGLLKTGEMLIVLGRPGSGCSTFLKTLSGEHHGLEMDKKSHIHYNGITQKQMLKEFKGEVIYNQEVDRHFPHLTVGETLEHAAALRMSSHRPMGVSRKEAIEHIAQVVMAIYGLSHTYNTKVGNDYVRGVSGGERKRVSIAEMALAGAKVVSWDNSTRGLDSATALTFTKSLRQSANLVGSCHAVAIYQASQAIYDLFDRAVVLYEGREIFFGRADKAKAYFERMGWHCPSRQTTGDFLTSVTNPVERKAREGYEDRVPRTPDDFEAYWHNSPEYTELLREIEAHEQEYPLGGESQLQDMRTAKQDMQANHVRPKSSYIVSVPMQIRLNTKRAWRRIINDKASTFTPLIGNIVLALIIGSVFYGTPQATAGFGAFGAALFFAILLNALTAISEINSLYEQRPIVEKHKSYAFYRPFTEALAGIVMDIPLKFAQAVVFNIILYFLVGLRREAGQFFLFFLVNFVSIFVMSAVFRTVAAVTKTVSQAMSLAGVLVLAIVIYTGFVVPVKYMGVWFSWIRWINPVFYAFEMLVANQFHGQNFACSQLVPPNPIGDSFICSTRGAVAGQLTVNGDDYIMQQYSYSYSHVWRNFGILLAFLFGFMFIYMVAVELNSSTSSTAEVLVFRRGHVPAYMKEAEKQSADEEDQAAAGKVTNDADQKNEAEDAANVIPPQKDVFTWRNVNYDIEIKGEPRRLLDDVSGFIKPGTLTALMGTSGAGKTTLLDVLAQRTSTGVVTGNMFVNGAPLDSSFQRKTGYVQQQDLHLETATVRESLRFSAMLRQPKSVSKQEKYDYVEDVIKMLNMEDFAEAVVGSPGEGLNVEQRKLLTIGVELAAKPKILLFLDEPTSGLDSQSSWAICSFLRKLADAGQAVLCTIHQPSAILFQQFDRLLFLRKGGKTVYFGDIGENSRTLLDYFEKNGARRCEDAENPAEYMLEIAADEKWVGVWRDSPKAKDVQTEIDAIHQRQQSAAQEDQANSDPRDHDEFAMPLTAQLWEVTRRVFQQYWRMPSYIFAKMILSAASGLFIGFSFYKADTSLQGMQNVLYAIFMSTTAFSTLVQQIMPLFVTQRSLYEVRERPSKAYSWKAFLVANVIVEIPYQIVAGVLLFATFYYPVIGVNQSSERQGLVLLFDVVFFIYASTFAHLCIAALPDSQTAGSIVTLLFSMTLIFNGVMQTPQALPGFWIFMYRVSPLTYWVGGIASTLLHGRQVICAPDEVNIFDPPPNMTCGQYLAPFAAAGGTLQNPGATSSCEYCSLSVADQFLAGSEIYWSQRWRNFGLMWAYIVFNVAVAVLLYYFFRVWPVQRKSKTKTRAKKAVEPKPAIEKSEPDEYSSDETPPQHEKELSYEEGLAELPHLATTDTARRRSEAGLYRQLSQTANSYFNHNKALGRINTKNAQVF